MKRRETRSRRLIEALAVAGVMVGMTGCPQPIQDTPDAAPDAFVVMDSGVADAALPPDAFVPPDATFDGGPPDAAGPPCATEGEQRSQTCACSARRIETCIRGSWRVTTPCDYECEPGTRIDINDRCGIGYLPCFENCRYGTEAVWEVPPSQCNPGVASPFCPGMCDCRADCTCRLLNDRGECL
jgi:hypothetical protein